MTLTPFNRVQTHEMFKHLNHTQPNRRLQRPPPHPASPAANQLHCGWAATLELDRAAPQRPIPARIVATLVNRPGMSGDSSSWKGWGHVRWFIEEV
ncbi:hypothetical protein, partial [Mycobacterium tuberculosis]|uniref:hypothetical protein n=2 Tax=Mycobacterium tuberculosis TaxID=1773 RepID=UPI001BDE90ED